MGKKEDPLWYRDILNKTFGKLTVRKIHSISDRKLYSKAKNSHYTRKDIYYLCDCSCGETKIVFRTNLITSHTKSCGCLKIKKKESNPSWTGCGQLGGRMWSKIKSHAENRNISMDITIVDAWELFKLQKSLCRLTGVTLTHEYIEKGKRINGTASLDRIDSSKAYTKDNIQWVHKEINLMKRNYKQKRFIELCKLVSDHQNKTGI